MGETESDRSDQAGEGKAVDRVILLAHGSKAESWKSPFESLLQRLHEKMREERRGEMSLAYMEFARPSLEESFDEARADSMEKLVVLPLFIAVGTHVGRDIPRRIAAYRTRFPEIEIDLLPALGEEPEFLDTLAGYIYEYLCTKIGE
ncbi:MAG: CbiX/SirB N-terminal domain-containing protein [Spirochaetia bacterium]